MEILDSIQIARREMTGLKQQEKNRLDTISAHEDDLRTLRVQINSSQDNLNKLELGLRAALAGVPSPVEVPLPIKADAILDQVGREG